jgi:type I restriction enzyme R subunit
VAKLKKVLGSGRGDANWRRPEAEEAAYDELADGPDAALWASARHRGKQKNLSFFAFTATPKPRRWTRSGRSGRTGIKRPFHTYSMRQAIAEGFILDVLANYTTYGVYYKLANATPRNDPEMETRKGRAALARFASLHPYALDAKAEVIIEHFRQKTAGKIDGPRQGDGRDPLAAARGAHAGRWRHTSRRRGTTKGSGRCGRWWRSRARVVDPDAPEAPRWTEAGINGFSEAALPKRFRGPSSRCSSWRRSTRPGSTSRCCTRCMSTRSCPGSRPCRPCRG